MKFSSLNLISMCCLLFLGISQASAEGLEVGSKPAEFSARDDQGKEWKSTDHVGKHFLVVYFYPADMTGGCTKQACSYRDGEKLIEAAGVEVIGVSGDTVENHKIFKEAHNLNFTLLADTEGKVAQAFGVTVKPGSQTVTKEIEGKKVDLTRTLTTSRWTFVIDMKGNVIYKNTNVKPEQDLKEVLEAVKKMKG